MASMFRNLFMTVWLTSTLVFTFATVLTLLTLSPQYFYLDFLRPVVILDTLENDAPSPLLTTARQAAVAGGLAGLQTWVEDHNARGHIPLAIVPLPAPPPLPLPPDATRRYGKTVPPDHIKALLRTQGPVVTTKEGATYRLVLDVEAIRPLFLVEWWGFGGLRLVIAALLSALACWLLTRHFTNPIRQLQLATTRLATGDLAARVGPDLGGRRDELGQLGEDFDRMAKRLQDLMDAQGRLLRDLSHELRTPLARVEVALEIARRLGDANAQQHYDRIAAEVERLEELIGQILTLSRLEADTQGVRAAPVDLVDLVEAIVDDARFEASQGGPPIAVCAPPHCPMEADGRLLHSAIENVLRNALGYAPGTVPVEVTLAPKPKAGQVTLTIRDWGPGVPEADLPRLFAAFYRVGEARDRQSGGHGLGLAIARRVVDHHGGTIAAHNAPGGGLCVVFTLPLTPQSGVPGD